MSLRGAVEARLERLVLISRIAPFNPRPRTVQMLTGLPKNVVNGLFESKRLRTGRLPCANEWYHTATLVERMEASIFASLYKRNREHGFDVTNSLIEAYGRFCELKPNGVSVSFDRAFFLVAQLEPGRFRGFAEQSLSLACCPKCGARHLVQCGARPAEDGCVICRFIARYSADGRLQAHFEAHQPVARAAASS